jgi:SPP1 family predicted phage head-tail adaptor
VTSIAIGNLRTRLRLQQPVEATTAGGGQTVTWVDSDSVWCDMQADAAFEQLVGGGTQAVRRWKLTMRLRSDVTAKSRFRRETDGLTLNVTGMEDQTGEELLMIVHCASKI